MNTPQERNAERRKRIGMIIEIMNEQVEVWRDAYHGFFSSDDLLKAMMQPLYQRFDDLFVMNQTDNLGFCMEPENQEQHDGTI